MSNATKTLLTLFVILLIITGLVKFTGNGNASRALSQAVVKLDTAKVDKVIIKNGKTGDVELTKANKSWKVKSLKGSKGYKADKQEITSALSRINNVMPVSVVTRDKNKFRRYQVDTTGTLVQFYYGNKKMAGIYIGRFNYSGPGNMTTYIRRAGQNDVFAVNGMLAGAFTKKMNDWRDKNIWKIMKSNINKIDMIYPADSSYSAMPVKEEKWVSGKDTLDLGLFSEVLDQLTDFTANGFQNNLSPEQFGKPLYEIKIHMNNGVVKDIKFKPDDTDSTSYIAVANGYPYVFKENKNLYDTQVFRSRNYELNKTHDHTQKRKMIRHK